MYMHVSMHLSGVRAAGMQARARASAVQGAAGADVYR